MGRYTVCPYYQTDRRKTIRCEDALRLFRTLERKDEWMSVYCDGAWKECPYAAALAKAYEEGGDAVEELKRDQSQEEYRVALSMLGKTEAKLKAKEEANKELRRKNKDLHAKADRWEGRARELQKKLRESEKEKEKMAGVIVDQVNTIMAIYEKRIAYLMTFLDTQSFSDVDVDTWSEMSDYKITSDGTKDNRIWRLEVKPKGDKDESDKPDRETDKEPEREIHTEPDSSGDIHAGGGQAGTSGRGKED